MITPSALGQDIIDNLKQMLSSCVLLMQPSQNTFIKIKPFWWQSRQIIFPRHAIQHQFRKIKFRGHSLKLLFPTNLTSSVPHYSYQTDKRAKPGHPLPRNKVTDPRWPPFSARSAALCINVAYEHRLLRKINHSSYPRGDPGYKHKLGHGFRQSPKPRTAVLTRASSNFLGWTGPDRTAMHQPNNTAVSLSISVD